MADGIGRKRQRLSGSDYRKLRLGRESSAAKQKDAILKFIKRPASDEAHNNHNELNEDSTSDSETQNVASAERSFSKLKLIKSYLRSQMSQARLVGLATISIEKKIADQLNMEELIREFASLKA